LGVLLSSLSKTGAGRFNSPLQKYKNPNTFSGQKRNYSQPASCRLARLWRACPPKAGFFLELQGKYETEFVFFLLVFFFVAVRLPVSFFGRTFEQVMFLSVQLIRRLFCSG